MMALAFLPGNSMPFHYKMMPSPVGDLRLIASESGLAALVWKVHRHEALPGETAEHNPEHSHLLAAEKQLNEYFAGERTQFTLSLDLRGTPFQQRVWAELQHIPYGETCSYLDIARGLGDEKATRAVGAANGRNPVSIIVPCHRVIGANGSLTGYGGGMERKHWLLDHETRGTRLF
jgi:methylated-DNA-[protein]-cysteine S-methyltransferase